jgi:FkbM family methyltransferase
MTADKVINLYNKTFRHFGPLHKLTRAIAWKGGDALVSILSMLRRFEVSHDELLPLYKLEMLIGTYESETVEICRKLISPGMTVLDIGAHIGYFTLLFSQLVGSKGRVFAFEPHPSNYRILMRNVKRRTLDNVTLIRKAVSDKQGYALFYETPLSVGHSLLPAKSYATQFPVEITSIDYFLRESAVTLADFVKIDVEAGEPEVIEGMRYLAEHSPNLSLILEYKRNLLAKRNYNPVELFHSIFSMGFDIFVIQNHGKLFKVQPDAADKIALSIEKCNLLAQKPATA